MLKCKVFEETEVYQPSTGSVKHSAAWNFNAWSAETDYVIESVESHANMNGEVRSIVIFYEEPEEMMIKSCNCGGKAEVHSWEIEEDDESEYTFNMYYVECKECHKRIPILQETEEDAIKQWNELYADMPKEKLEEKFI